MINYSPVFDLIPGMEEAKEDLKNGLPAEEGETEQSADQVRKLTTPLPCYTYTFTYSRTFVAISGVAYRRRFSPPISMSVCLALHCESS